MHNSKFGEREREPDISAHFIFGKVIRASFVAHNDAGASGSNCIYHPPFDPREGGAHQSGHRNPVLFFSSLV
jgi:hypothetical protein